MDDDVDMDAPHISILREDTPPPSRSSKFRVKLLVSDNMKKGTPSVPAVARKNAPRPQRQSEEEVDEEDEEDQLIDDDEPAPSISAPVASVSAGTKRKAPPKKPSRPRKNDKQDKEDKKPDEPPLNEDGLTVTEAPLPEKPPPKKKPAPRKTAGAPKPKTKAPPKGAKALAIAPVEDTAMSETHTVTAPSSPFPVSRGPSPEETEPPPPLVPEQPGETVPLPLPVYPLPSKPFPVQPPPKIGTGFAPIQPLDRSGAKVRQWRVANREIRGIAGGRWFARSWVGDRESDFAATAAMVSTPTNAKVVDSEKISVSKSSASAPATGKTGKFKVLASAGISAGPSRSGSMAREPHTTTKAPTKMRNIITGPASKVDDEPEVIRKPPSISIS